MPLGFQLTKEIPERRVVNIQEMKELTSTRHEALLEA